MRRAIRILDQHRVQIERGTRAVAASSAARRAVMILDDLLWERPIRFDEAVRLLNDDPAATVLRAVKRPKR